MPYVFWPTIEEKGISDFLISHLEYANFAPKGIANIRANTRYLFGGVANGELIRAVGSEIITNSIERRLSYWAHENSSLHNFLDTENGDIVFSLSTNITSLDLGLDLSDKYGQGMQICFCPGELCKNLERFLIKADCPPGETEEIAQKTLRNFGIKKKELRRSMNHLSISEIVGLELEDIPVNPESLNRRWSYGMAGDPRNN